MREGRLVDVVERMTKKGKNETRWRGGVGWGGGDRRD